MFRIRRAAVAALVASVASLVAVVPAHATLSDLACLPLHSNGSITYSPPLSNTPQTVAFYLSRSYQSCMSLSNPAITSGTSASSGFLEASCGVLLSDGPFSFTVTWNTGQTSQFEGTFASTHVAGILTGATTGATVTAGVFAGSSLSHVNTFPLSDADLLQCELGQSTISGFSGPLTLAII